MAGRARVSVLVIGVMCVLSVAGCGGPSDARLAGLAALPQPTPDPTLDAVVRNLPHELAGVSPTPTPAPLIKRSAPAPTVAPKPSLRRSPTPTPTRKPAR